jgi:hypothetical protein
MKLAISFHLSTFNNVHANLYFYIADLAAAQSVWFACGLKATEFLYIADLISIVE